MTLPFQSLSAATATGPGAVLDLQGCRDSFTTQVIGSGAGSTSGGWQLAYVLEGSLNGTDFVTLTEQVDSHGNSEAVIGGTGTGVVSFNQMLNTANQFVNGLWSLNFPLPAVRYVRINLYSAIDVASFTLDAWIGSPDHLRST